MTHELVDSTLYVEKGGIIGRCTCGWTTGHRFSRIIASVAFTDHKEAAERQETKQGCKQE